MNLKEFAVQHRLLLSKSKESEADSDGRVEEVKGKHGDISYFGGGKMLASFYGDSASKTRARRINIAIENKYGECRTGSGGDEAMFIFDPSLKKNAKGFIKLLGCKTKRELSPERRAQLVETLAKARAKKTR